MWMRLCAIFRKPRPIITLDAPNGPGQHLNDRQPLNLESSALCALFDQLEQAAEAETPVRVVNIDRYRMEWQALRHQLEQAQYQAQKLESQAIRPRIDPRRYRSESPDPPAKLRSIA